MTPKHTIELFDLGDNSDGQACPERRPIGYRIISHAACLESDADYLLRSLAETLSHIGQKLPDETTQGAYPWPC
jgi:hypothetical protein